MISITQLLFFLIIMILLFGDIKKITAYVQQFLNKPKDNEHKD